MVAVTDSAKFDVAVSLLAASVEHVVLHPPERSISLQQRREILKQLLDLEYFQGELTLVKS